MTSYFDVSDAEGLRLNPDDDDSEDVECIHGHDLFAHCDECAVIKLSAADGGEGDDMGYHNDTNDEPITGAGAWESRLSELLYCATDVQLKQVRYGLEREEKRRLEAAQATIRALDPKAPKPRARRSDAGHPRAPKAANDVPREGGVAV